MKILIHTSFVASVLLAACLIGGCGAGVSPGEDVGTPVLMASPGDSHAQISWTATGSRYELFRDGNEISNGHDTSYNDDGLTNGTRYCYQVRALDASGSVHSLFSDNRCVTPMGTPVLTATALSLAATLDWDVIAGASSYNLYQFVPSTNTAADVTKAVEGDDVLIAEDIPPNVTTYELTGLSNNCVTYDYRIIPVDGDGNESAADIQYVSVTPDTMGYVDPTFADGVPIQLTMAGYVADVMVRDDEIIIALQNGDERKLIGFADDGEMLWEIEFDGSHEMTEANAFAIDQDGRIVVVGARSVGAKACRLIPAGDSYVFDDAGFGDGMHSGCSEFGIEHTRAWDIDFDSLNRIVVAGQTGSPSSIATIWRLTDGGSPDTGFANEGTYNYGVDPSYTRSVVVAHNGADENIYASGAGLGTHALLLVLSESGNLIDDIELTVADRSFSNIKVTPDGNLIMAGYSEGEHLGFVWEFTPIPTVEGTAVLMFNTTTSGHPMTLNIDCANRLLAGGQMEISSIDVGFVFRSLPGFAVRDMTFAEDGWYVDSATAGTNFISAIAIDKLGRLVIAGASEFPAIWRLQ